MLLSWCCNKIQAAGLTTRRMYSKRVSVAGQRLYLALCDAVSRCSCVLRLFAYVFLYYSALRTRS